MTSDNVVQLPVRSVHTLNNLISLARLIICAILPVLFLLYSSFIHSFHFMNLTLEHDIDRIRALYVSHALVWQSVYLNFTQ